MPQLSLELHREPCPPCGELAHRHPNDIHVCECGLTFTTRVFPLASQPVPLEDPRARNKKPFDRRQPIEGLDSVPMCGASSGGCASAFAQKDISHDSR
jgi:hypothetical protein